MSVGLDAQSARFYRPRTFASCQMRRKTHLDSHPGTSSPALSASVNRIGLRRRALDAYCGPLERAVVRSRFEEISLVVNGNRSHCFCR